MSADNILVILQYRKKVRVYDVNFSDVSSRDDWNFPISADDSKSLTDYIVQSRYYLAHECDTADQAEGFCIRYCRENIVEYDYGSIIKHH